MLVFQLKDNQPIKAHEKQGPCLAIWESRTCADLTWKFKKTVVPLEVHITEAYATWTRAHIKQIPEEVLQSP